MWSWVCSYLSVVDWLARCSRSACWLTGILFADWFHLQEGSTCAIFLCVSCDEWSVDLISCTACLRWFGQYKIPCWCFLHAFWMWLLNSLAELKYFTIHCIFYRNSYLLCIEGYMCVPKFTALGLFFYHTPFFQQHILPIFLRWFLYHVSKSGQRILLMEFRWDDVSHRCS
jgi:hypothetical protein